MPFNVEHLAPGDRVRTQIVNKKGDRNLDGMYLTGTVVSLNMEHRFAKLDTGWCVHDKDNLIWHRTAFDARANAR